MGKKKPSNEKTALSEEKDIEEGKRKHEKTMKQVQEEIDLLKDENLLINIVNEVHKEGLVGEEASILILLNKIFLRLVQDYSATSSNILISDKTGGGKDFLASCVCKTVLPERNYHHRTDISDKAFDYWQPIIQWEEIDGKNKPIKDSWNGHVIHLEDPREEALIGQSFKVMASGGTHVTKIINFKPVTIEIDGKPIIIVTSLNVSIDEEAQRRWDSLRIDTSEKLTEAVKKSILNRASGGNGNNKNQLLRDGLNGLLSRHDVVIPYARQLEKTLPNKLIMRTQIKKLLDYIKSSAVLHQYQRERDKKGRLIANWFDYDFARFVFIILKDIEGVTLNSAEEEFIVFLKEQDRPLSIKEAAEMFKKRSSSWIYNHLESFVTKNLVEVSYQQDESNRNITQMRTTQYEENVGIPSSYWFSTQFQKGLEKEQQKEFQSFQSFYNILKILDENREKKGLNPIFKDWYHNIEETQESLEKHTEITEVNKEKNENKNGKELEESLHEKVNNLRKFIEKNRRGGYSITDDFLSHNFDKKFIDQCKNRGLLLKNSKGEYDFNWK
jgi:hypothetical protein